MKIARIEAIRGFAALYVVYSHAVLYSHALAPYAAVRPLQWSARFGQEAVILFFLISGFVIRHSHETAQDKSFRRYIRARILRIYPIFLLSLLAAAVVGWGSAPGLDWRTLAGNLIQLQDVRELKPGVWFEVFGANFPLWSLSYEWWFYLLFFPLAQFVPPERARWLVALVSGAAVIAYVQVPNQACLYLSYFAIWWTGAELAGAYLADRPVRPVQFLPLAVVTLLWCWPVAMLLEAHAPRALGVYPILQLRHAVFAGMAALAALAWRKVRWVGFDATLGRLAVVAPISYALYVFHFPILLAPAPAGVPGPLLLIADVLAILALSLFAEGPFQRFANRLWPAPLRMQAGVDKDADAFPHSPA